MLPLLVALAAGVVLDAGARTIPDVVTLPALGWALVLAATGRGPALRDAMIGALGAGTIVLAFALVSRGAVGGGDVKLMAMIGAALGWKGALVVLAASQLIGGAFAVVLLVTRRAGRRTALPIGVVMAALAALLLLGRPL